MNKNIEKLVKEGIKKISPYEPGKPIEELQREYKVKKTIKLASNENPFGPSKKVKKAIEKSIENINRYPDGSSYELKNELSKYLKLPVENIMIGSGSSEVISLTLETFINHGEEILYPWPSFTMYRIFALKNNAIGVEIQLENNFSYNLKKFLERITPKTKVIILCNPNNPTGTIIKKREMENFIKNLPDDIILISDEAYFDYVESNDFGSAFPFFKEKNIIICRTFAKIYGLAGLRIGYGIANKDIIGYIERIRPPFNVTTPSQMAVIASLQDQKHIENVKKKTIEGKKYLYSEFKKMGIEYILSESNFILCKFGKNTDKIVKELEKRGIIVRGMASFGLPEYIRITIGTEEENKIFINNLKDILKK